MQGQEVYRRSLLPQRNVTHPSLTAEGWVALATGGQSCLGDKKGVWKYAWARGVRVRVADALCSGWVLLPHFLPLPFPLLQNQLGLRISVYLQDTSQLLRMFWKQINSVGNKNFK